MKQEYTSYELYEMITHKKAKRGNAVLGKDRLIKFCKNAGLEIQFIRKEKNNNLYKIITNNYYIENEKWIDCYILPEFYEVSNLGRIRKKDNKQLLGSVDKNNNYIEIKLTDKNTKITKNYKAHRLIYFSFNPQFIKNDKNITIDHIDGCRYNNNLNNLRCLTLIDNIKTKDNNQTAIRSLTTELIIKYGYDKTKEMLIKLLNKET